MSQKFARLLDLETVAVDNLDLWLSEDDVKAPANLKDPDKIAAAKADKLAKARASAALDPRLNRIIVWGEGNLDGDQWPEVLTTEDDERRRLAQFWTWYDNCHDEMIGFNLLSFDLPTIIMRSWLLGVKPSLTEVSRYRPGRIVDLRMRLGFGDPFAPGSCDWWCKRFGITVEDAHSGADVAALYAAKDYTAILAHCDADLERLRQLWCAMQGGRPAVNVTCHDTF